MIIRWSGFKFHRKQISSVQLKCIKAKKSKLILRLFGIHKILDLLTLKISHDPYWQQKHHQQQQQQQKQHNNQVQVVTVCIFNLWQKYSIDKKIEPENENLFLMYPKNVPLYLPGI